MPVCRRLPEDRPAQPELFDDRLRAKVEVLAHDLHELFLGHPPRAEGVDVDGDGVRHADRVGELDLTLVRKARRHNVLADIARHVRRAAVDFGRVLPRERPAAVRAPPAVGIHDDLAPRQTAVPRGAADLEPARRVDIVLRVRVQPLPADDGLDDVLLYVRAELFLRDLFVMLRGDDDGIHADGLAVLVFDGDLRLPVGAQVGQRAVLAHRGEPLCELLREHVRQRHEFGRLVHGVAEHHALVPRADLVVRTAPFLALERGVHAERDVRALRMDRRDDGEGIIGEPLPFGVADLLHGILDDARDVDVTARGELAHDEHHARRGAALDCRAGAPVLREHRVQHRVRDLVAHLVGVPLRHALARKKFLHMRLCSCAICRFIISHRGKVVNVFKMCYNAVYGQVRALPRAVRGGQDKTGGRLRRGGGYSAREIRAAPL